MSDLSPPKQNYNYFTAQGSHGLHKSFVQPQSKCCVQAALSSGIVSAYLLVCHVSEFRQGIHTYIHTYIHRVVSDRKMLALVFFLKTDSLWHVKCLSN
jgi:hypothetical protein